mmetsp:Transcript_19640/g.29802  ORF Transcript_19640/g.29802 Transcript_19640/m.29802 type:complete len:88 (+) Transcript_19640:1497-1760(+)
MLPNAGKGWCPCATNIGLGRALGEKDCISKGGNKLIEQYNQGWGAIFLKEDCIRNIVCKGAMILYNWILGGAPKCAHGHTIAYCKAR